MATNYQRGVYAERKCMAFLRAIGFTAVRTAGSHGPFDVIAWNKYGVRLVQVKRSNKQRKPSQKERDGIEAETAPWNCSKEVWIYQTGIKEPIIWRMN